MPRANGVSENRQRTTSRHKYRMANNLRRWQTLVNKLTEAWFATKRVRTDYREGHVDVFINPSRAELQKLLREYGHLRGTVNNDDVYVWNGEVLHNNVDVPGRINFQWMQNRQFEAQWDFGGEEPTWEEQKDIIDYLKSIHRLRPLLAGYSISVVSMI